MAPEDDVRETTPTTPPTTTDRSALLEGLADPALETTHLPATGETGHMPLAPETTKLPGESAGLEPMVEDPAPADEGPEPVDETLLYPLPAPSYDEEHGMSIGEATRYDEDYSRISTVTVDPRKDREIPFPHMGDQDGRGHRVPGEGRSRGGCRPLIALLLVSVMATIICAAATYGLEMWGGKSVPNVVGVSEGRARLILGEEGFAVETRTHVADDGIGFVLEQNPESGVRLEEGSTVIVTVAVSRTMPDVVGMMQEEAVDLLSKAGAEDIKIAVKYSSEEEGTVISVDPAAGEGFSSYQTIMLTVAQKAQVPDVIGKEKVEATALIEDAGFKIDAQYVRSDAQPNTAVECDPEPGTKLDPGSTVHVYFAEPMPSDPLHIAEYFGKDSANIDRYLGEKGYRLTWAGTSGGRAEATYTSDAGLLMFVDRPYYNLYPANGDTSNNSMADGLPFSSVRWEVSQDYLPSGAAKLTDDATRELMARCGLSNITDVCSHVDVNTPSWVSKSGAKFRCSYGETAGFAWSVLLVYENGSARATVSCAPLSYYQNIDLSAYGGSACDYIACGDVYNGV